MSMSAWRRSPGPFAALRFILGRWCQGLAGGLGVSGRARNRRESTLLHLEALEDRTLLSTFTVLNTNDSGPGSLRQAILDANSNPGLDTIRFQIGTGAHTIHVGSGGFGQLPVLTDPVVLDGTTQPGFEHRPLIELDGTNAGGGADGLSITAGGSTVRGLVINRFQGNGIVLRTGGGNRIESDYLGTDATGTAAFGNHAGLLINGSANNTVGGTTPDSRNIISGNTQTGVLIENAGSTGNVVVGNYIGTDVTGTDAIGNYYGINISFSGGANTIGGAAVGARNIISGNFDGVVIGFDFLDVVVGNYIGTDVTGTDPLGNTGSGVFLFGGNSNTVGGTTAASRNVISGNGVGIDIIESFDVVAGNYIGTDMTGTDALRNTSDGVLLENGASNNVVGGTAAGAGNVISANGVAGVLMRDFGTNNNSILGNRIGTDARGTDDLPNGRVGVGIYREAEGNNVGVVFDPDGVTRHPAGNLIADNDGPGVWLNAGFQAVDFNTIRDNRGAGVAVSDLLTRRDTPPRTGYLPGDLAPDFELKDQNGHDVSLSDFAGKFVVLDFCAAWCGPCQQLTHQIPDVIQRLTNLHIPFEYVQVLVENGNTNPATLANAQAWAQRFGLSSPVLWGPQAEGLFQKWGGSAFPTVVLLNPDRTSYFEFLGFNPSDQIASWVSAEANGMFSTPNNAHNDIRYNTISGNRHLGIDLGNDGVTANTPGTHSSGPNHFQNYPVLTSVVPAGTNKTVSGYLDSTPNTTFQIQFFVNAESDDSGHGQGQYFLGETLVTSDANGHATFRFTYRPITGASFLSATATDDSGNGNTSEFSRNISDSEDDGPGGSGSEGSDLRNLAPRPGSVQENGGLIWTRAQLPGSAALNAGVPDQFIGVDQAGMLRSGGINLRAYLTSAADFLLSDPGTVTARMPFNWTVITVDVSGQEPYTGTVTFASANRAAVLPNNYRFQPGDQGNVVFSVMQNTPGPLQPTGTDTANGALLGSFDLLVTDPDALGRAIGIWTARSFAGRAQQR